MDQLSLYASSDASESFERIKPQLISYLNEIGGSEKDLIWSQNKDYYSIRLNNLLIAKIYGKNTIYFAFPERYYDNIIYDKKSSFQKVLGFRRVAIDSYQDLSNYVQLIKLIIANIKSESGNGIEFGCCHRYMECSNEKHCVHPDLAFSSKCSYRQTLLQGKVFYGKNRNI